MGKIAAGNKVPRSTAKGILLIVVRDTDGAFRTVNLPVVLVQIYVQVRPQLRKASK